MIIVGMTGPAGAGKDTMADYLVEYRRFVKLSFAGPLKAMLATVGMPEPADRAAKEQPIPGFNFTWREAAQKLGTEWGRSLDPDIWVKVMENALSRFADDARIVLSDVRFENEAAMLRRVGGKVVHVAGRRADLGASAGHASEAGIALVEGDIRVDNSASLDAALLDLSYALFDGGL